MKRIWLIPVFAAGINAYPLLMNGGLQFALGSESVDYYQGPSVHNNTFHWGLGGQLLLGMGSGNFGALLGNAVWLGSNQKKEKLGDLVRNSPAYRLDKEEYATEVIDVKNSTTRFANMVYLTYYLPHEYPGSFGEKIAPIMANLNIFVGLGPVMEHKFRDSDIASFSLDERLKRSGIATSDATTDKVDMTNTADIMDFGWSAVVGFNVNFWKNATMKNKFLEKQLRNTYLTIEIIFYNNMTPDNENTPDDNRDIFKQTEWILHIGPSTLLDI